jgi:hypothetical protein
MIRAVADLSLAFALFIAGRLVLAFGGRAVRALRSRYYRSGNRQPDCFGRQVQGVRIHEEGNAL